MVKQGPVGVEEALVRAFIRPNQRERYLTRLGDPRMRDKLMRHGEWHHSVPLDLRYATLIEGRRQNEADIYDLLKSKGAPDLAYVIGGCDLDGMEVALRDALDDVVPYGTGFISCIPGRLAYYGGESPGGRYILERT